MGTATRDRLLVAACVLLQFVSIHTGDVRDADVTTGAVGPLVGLVVGLLAALALLGRRRAPVMVLSVVTAGYVAQTTLTGPVLPAAELVACYTVARHGESALRRAVVAGVAVTASSVTAVGVAASSTGDPGLVPWYVVSLLVAVLAGVTGASRAARLTWLTREAAAQERLRIARDLHDTVGHGMGAIAVQAGAGRLALDADAVGDARQALITIEQSGRDVLREVRWLVGLLRDRPDQPGLADLADLAESARQAGLSVDLSTIEDRTNVSAVTGEVAYRIVQESLTNVIRHSDARHVTVRIHLGSELIVEVSDDGSSAEAAAEGLGVRGMRERAGATGGELSVGPRDDAPGWRVAATLPLGKKPR
jgi:signal transduction histidine kinase